MTKTLIEKIKELDNNFSLNRPSHIEQGRIVYTMTADGLYNKFNLKTERLATAMEVMRFRVEAFHQLCEEIPALNGELEQLLLQRNILAGKVLEVFDYKPEVYGVWKTRLTTSTHMVRTEDLEGNDTIFFYDGNPFNGSGITEAVRGELSDGGFEYSSEALKKVREETLLDSRLSFEDYLNARGGNFSGEDWLNHPIFKTVCTNNELMKEYVFALQILDLFSIYNPGLHSGWRPGEMKKNFGRPVSLGFKGEAFYPPNNSTLDHAALVVNNSPKAINLNHNPDYGTLIEVFNQFSDKLAEHNEIESGLVRPTNGATGALGAIFSATRIRDANEGRRSIALLASPEYFDTFKMLNMYGFSLVTTENGVLEYPTEEVITSLRNIVPSLVYISVPNNPTGVLLPQDELENILDQVSDKTRVVLDKTLVHPEAYLKIADLQSRYGDKDIVVVDSFSKSMGVVRNRVGYLVAFQQKTIDSMGSYVHTPNVWGMTQVMGLLEDASVVEELVRKNLKSDEILREWNSTQDRAKYSPSLSNFAIIEINSFSGKECRERLEAEGFLVRSGEQLYMSNKYIRIDMGQPEMLPNFLETLDKILA